MRAAACFGTCAAAAPANASSTARRIGLIPLHYSIRVSLCTNAEQAVGGDPGPEFVWDRGRGLLVAEHGIDLGCGNQPAAAGGGALHAAGGADFAVADEFEAAGVQELVPARRREAEGVAPGDVTVAAGGAEEDLRHGAA